MKTPKELKNDKRNKNMPQGLIKIAKSSSISITYNKTQLKHQQIP
jgi:hypothetical protein